VLSPQQEVDLGVKAYNEILAKYKQEHVLAEPDDPDVQRVRTVGERIVKAAQNPLLQREINLHLEGYNYQWRFNVVRSKQINAFCLPGGGVIVFTGLLGIIENDSQLATVMSHEIAHALAHHANERIARQNLSPAGLVALKSKGGLDQVSDEEREKLLAALDPGAAEPRQGPGVLGRVRELGYDRQQESEADHIGLFLMTFAGYDPDQALVFWQRMQAKAPPSNLPTIFSDHPSNAQRIGQMQEWIPEAKGAYLAYKNGRVVHQ
jgi:predicted Zn-dependent protease